MKPGKYITPLTLAAAGTFMLLIYFLWGNDAADTRMPITTVALACIGTCLAADFLLKKIGRLQGLRLWLAEMGILLAAIYLWIIAD